MNFPRTFGLFCGKVVVLDGFRRLVLPSLSCLLSVLPALLPCLL